MKVITMNGKRYYAYIPKTNNGCRSCYIAKIGLEGRGCSCVIAGLKVEEIIYGPVGIEELLKELKEGD